MPHPTTIINPEWAKRLKTLCNECKLTQTELSEKIYLSQQTISKIMNGRARLTQETAQKIVEVFPKYRAEWLLGIDNVPTRFEQAMSDLKSFAGKYGAAIYLLEESLAKQQYRVEIVASPNSATGYDSSILKLSDDNNEFCIESNIIAEIIDFVDFKADRLIKEARNNG